MIISTTKALKFDCERLWLAFATGNTFRYIDATAFIMEMAPSNFEDSTPALCILADKPSIDDVMNVLPTIERLMKIIYEL